MSLLRTVALVVLFAAPVACGGDPSTSSPGDTGAEDTHGDAGPADAADATDAPDGSGAGDAADADAPLDAPPLSARIVRLRAEGTAIVGPNGEPVQLRGVNLGGWMFHETWITGVDYPVWGRAWQLGVDAGLREETEAALVEVGQGDDEEWVAEFRDALAARAGADAADALVEDLAAHPSLWDDSDLPLRLALEDRFGTDGRDALLGTFQDAWIGERDIAWLADAGFNLVRVPIGYRNLLTNSDREPLTELRWNEASLERLDWLLDTCEAHGVWAVLDIQESPGGHNTYSGPAQLYGSPAFEALTRELWTGLATRFRDRDVVAAYSLLAEPFSAPSPEERDRVYDDLIGAIRDLGDDHLVIVHDGFLGMSTLPEPGTYSWTNVVYSTHLFEWSLDSLFGWEIFIGAFEPRYDADQAVHGVPWFIGSFSTMRDAPWAYDAARLLVDWYESRGWAWSVWTYRRLDDPLEQALFGTTTGWGVVGRLDGPFERPDVYRDDRATLEARLGGYAELPIGPNDPLVEALVGPRGTP